MKKRFFAILLCIPFLTGCWDKRELNEIAIVVAMGIDENPNTKELILTTQVVRPEAMRKNGNGSNKLPVEIVSSTGKTVFSAKQNIMKKFDRKPTFAHCKIVVISESLAEKGIQSILDYLVRSNEVRPLIWIGITKGASPKEVLSVNNGISTIQARYLSYTIKLQSENSETRFSYLQEFIEDLLHNGVAPKTGVMEVEEIFPSSSGNSGSSNDKEIKLTETAVFKKDRLLGYLTNEETLGLNWISGNIKRSTLNVPSLNEKGKVIATRVVKGKRSIKLEKKDDEYIFNIEINAMSELKDQQDYYDTSDPEILSLVEKEQSKLIEHEVKMVMEKMKNELKLDIAGLNKIVERKYPEEWKEIKDDWENVLPRVRYNVKVDSKIVRTGLLLEPMKIKE